MTERKKSAMGIGRVCWVVLSSALLNKQTYRSSLIITPDPISTFNPHGARSWPLSEQLRSFPSREELLSALYEESLNLPFREPKIRRDATISNAHIVDTYELDGISHFTRKECSHCLGYTKQRSGDIDPCFDVVLTSAPSLYKASAHLYPFWSTTATKSIGIRLSLDPFHAASQSLLMQIWKPYKYYSSAYGQRD